MASLERIYSDSLDNIDWIIRDSEQSAKSAIKKNFNRGYSGLISRFDKAAADLGVTLPRAAESLEKFRAQNAPAPVVKKRWTGDFMAQFY